MIDRFAASLALTLYENTNISLEESEQIHYALNVILGEFTKLFLLFIIFMFINKLELFLFSLLVLASIRTFSGGLHLGSNRECLIASLGFFLITCFFTEVTLNLSIIFYYIVAVISIILTFTGSPKPSVYRPILSNTRRLRLKLLSTTSTIIWFFILFFYIKNSHLFKCGFLTIVMQAIQLVKIQKGKKVKHE